MAHPLQYVNRPNRTMGDYKHDEPNEEPRNDGLNHQRIHSRSRNVNAVKWMKARSK